MRPGGDPDFEVNETFTITLSNPTNATFRYPAARSAFIRRMYALGTRESIRPTATPAYAEASE